METYWDLLLLRQRLKNAKPDEALAEVHEALIALLDILIKRL